MTAVEFLVETIDKKYINAFITRIVEQAKEMELEKLQQAYERGFNDARRPNNEFGSIFKEY